MEASFETSVAVSLFAILRLCFSLVPTVINYCTYTHERKYNQRKRKLQEEER